MDFLVVAPLQKAGVETYLVPVQGRADVHARLRPLRSGRGHVPGRFARRVDEVPMCARSQSVAHDSTQEEQSTKLRDLLEPSSMGTPVNFTSVNFRNSILGNIDADSIDQSIGVS